MNEQAKPVQRVIGFDSHPDSFTAAMVQGPTPAAAVVEKTFNKVPMAQLQSWAKKHTTTEDLFVLEASGNSFQVVRTLVAVGRKAKVLESCQIGKLKEAHANNDKISAVRIGKAYLAGTAKEVWVPDLKTQDRRDLFHAHRKAVKRTTQMNTRVRSYLSDNGVRLKKHSRQYTGRPWVGLNGTVVSRPHCEHVVMVSVLANPEPPEPWRLALHVLQRLGSFLKFLSWKKCCSPAVNTKSAPQSTHLRTRS